MYKNQTPYRIARGAAIVAVIGMSFLTLTVAGTRAANLSFFDSVRAYFGFESESAAAVQDEGNRALASTTFVISQAYGGGGGTTGTYLKDYVELKNISSSPQPLAGLSLVYGSATGQFASLATNAYALTGGTVPPGGYYLVELSPAGTAGAPLPVTADESTTNLNMSGTNGKVALVTSAFVANTCGGSATPCTLPNPAIIDLVAWGTANNAEGGAATNAGASLTSVQGNVRKNNGCQDTDNNNADFDIVTAPVPRNSAAAPVTCSGGPTPTATNTFAASPTNTATLTSTPTFTPSASPSPVQGGTLVISQFDGGGGGTTGTYIHDYVELKNISSAPQSLNGLSLYYGSAAGNFASTAGNAFALPDVTLSPGQYFLVELGPAGTAGAPLPVTPDASSTNLTMSGTNGKVALVTAGLAINTCGATATPCDATQLAAIVDWAAYGNGGNGTAGNGEGGTSVNNGAAMTATQGGVRKVNGCQDTNNNNNDFEVVTAPVPRNMASTPVACTGGPTPTATSTSTPGSPTPTHTVTATSTPTFTPSASPSPAQGGTLVISQFDGGGGGTTGTYIHDYIELKNVSTTSQSLNGLSLYYGSAAGNFASTASNAFALPDVTLAPGQYYLVELGPAGTAGAPLPVTPDASSGNLTMSGTNGKVALVTAGLPINTCGATATPCSAGQLAAIVDWAAYGTGGNGTAGNGEGGTSVNNGAAMTATQGGVRKQNGCQDTNNNNNDFDVVTAPVPRNMASAAAPCGPAGTPTNTPTASPSPTNTATATPTPLQGNTLVISQFDGGGGGSIGTYLNDYVEIKNVSSTTQSLNGLWLYYGAAAGNFASSATNAFALPNVTLAAGQYYLVQLGDPGTAGSPLPVTPDATTTNLNMAGTSGKIALVTASLPINTCGSTATPCSATQLTFIVDWAAYGTGGNGPAGSGEGGTSVNNGVAMTATQGGVRKQNGCQDTNNNNADFDVVTAPVPRNMASTPVQCSTGPTPTSTSTPTATATLTPTVTATATATATATGTPSGGRTAFDYDGDHKSDISLFRPADGAWYLQQSQAGSFGMLFGFGTDKIAPADYDGDGKTDIAVYRPSTGIWYVFNSSDSTFTYTIFGLEEDLPTPADYDGDGKADFSVYRPSSGTWYGQRSSNGVFYGVQFGATEDKPTIGDFDGDGKSDIAVFRPSTGAWYRIDSSDGSIHGELFGFGTDLIVPADYDGDHKTDIAVYRPSTGFWYGHNSSDGSFTYNIFGLANDIPAPADFDGDGKADLSVFRPSDGTWYRQNSSNGAFIAFQFGQNGDIPTQAAFRF